MASRIISFEKCHFWGIWTYSIISTRIIPNRPFPLPFGMSCAHTDQLELTGNNKRFAEPSFFLISTNVFYQGSELRHKPRHTDLTQHYRVFMIFQSRLLLHFRVGCIRTRWNYPRGAQTGLINEKWNAITDDCIKYFDVNGPGCISW